MRNIVGCLFIILNIMGASAQKVIKLWDENPPTYNGIVGAEINKNGSVSNVSVPELTVYLPEKTKKQYTAVIICPGGGYSHLAMEHEGHQFAKWLQSQGVAGIVLKYRLPNHQKVVPLEDCQQAIRYVRSKSVEWGISESKIGICGFSAGGHLASTASTRFSTREERPDFSILFYPVISMGNLGHAGSRENLLGEDQVADDIMAYSSEMHITEATPPALLLLSDDDSTVSPKNSIMYYDALKDNGVAASMYIFPTGGHGWGMKKSFQYHESVLTLLKSWLEGFE